ncbi:uncharacterized protein MKK02DRAFT_29962 [Dioszegia hungarica]|uniref:BTB domain-containing protein n=1 Tax=Dioszegia hungarica TaxID=4972 RepID=A0AA38H515_9TREE|nr:uncharacterized protein MKK02DRAFT_29962 [Dioszegia hungarica]KAI9632966.1 hypothetical protein MKK02DRAFT_29962 [Dioszegia hungarica]
MDVEAQNVAISSAFHLMSIGGEIESASEVNIVEAHQQATPLVSHSPTSQTSTSPLSTLSGSVSSASSETSTRIATDTIVLVTSDGVRHTTSRALLAAHSPFFADLFLLPSGETSSHMSDEIPIPNVTSAGLALILSVLDFVGLTPVAKPVPLHPAAYRYWLSLTVQDLIPIAEAAFCAHLYDIPTFSTAFVLPLLSRLAHQPVMGFALAAIATAEAELPSYRRRMLQAGIMPIRIPEDIFRIVKRFAPEQLERLQMAYEGFQAALVPLKEQLRWTQEVPNEHNGYSIRCRGGKAGYAPCTAFRRHGKWRRLREEAAENVLHEIKSKADGACDHEAILEVVERPVACGKCASRLTKAFLVAVQRCMARCGEI